MDSKTENLTGRMARLLVLDHFEKSIIPQLEILREKNKSFHLFHSREWVKAEKEWDQAEINPDSILFLLEKIIRKNSENLDHLDKMLIESGNDVQRREAWKTLFDHIPPHLRKMVVNMVKKNILMEKTSKPGMAMGLAASDVGGEVFLLECYRVPGGQGRILTAGFPEGNMMRTSAEIALSYCRIRAKAWGIHPEIFRRSDWHFHIEKPVSLEDGSSAGIAFAQAIQSRLLNKPLGMVSYTGTISPGGQIGSIGSVIQKAIAAFESGVETIFVPKVNLFELEEIFEDLFEEMEIRGIENMLEII